jgi:hypothetical protein
MDHSEKTGLAVKEFLIWSANSSRNGEPIIARSELRFHFILHNFTFQRRVRPTCQLTCGMSNYIVWRPWENVSKTTLRFMCAVKIDRRPFSVGISLLDDADTPDSQTIQGILALQSLCLPSPRRDLDRLQHTQPPLTTRGEGERFYDWAKELNFRSLSDNTLITTYFSASLSLT